MKTRNKKLGWDMFGLGLTAFGGLGMEILYAFFLEPLLYGAQASDWSDGQSIAHWILTCATWGCIAFWIVRSAKKNYGFDIFAVCGTMRTWQWAAAFLMVAAAIAIQYLDWGGVKCIREWQHLGVVKFVFQYLYYAFETVLFLLIIVFAQKSFEVWLGHENIPYGGIICGLTWGLGHALTKGSLLMGLTGILWGIALGASYLVVSKNIRKAWVVLFLMFAV